MTREKILIVEDETEISYFIQRYLQKEGYQVIISNNGYDAIQAVKQHSPNLILLDILLPGPDGFKVCADLRKSTDAPIIFISCKGEDVDKVLGLGVGGDDYITKPFSPAELVARVKAHLRRNRMLQASDPDPDSGHTITYNHIEIRLLSRIVSVNGTPVPLSSKEFELFSLFIKHPEKTFRLEELYEMVWGEKLHKDTRTVMVHISNLRRKLEVNPSDPQLILTVRGIGYRFNPVMLDDHRA